MQNYLQQPEIRQVLSPDHVAHPSRIKAGDEVEVVSVFPHGTDGDSSGWIAKFFYDGKSGCCDPRNLLKPAMYELQQRWAEIQERVSWLPAYERTNAILSILDDLEVVGFNPNLSALLLSSLLSGYRS